MHKLFDIIDRWFEVWVVAIAIITGSWVLFRIVEFVLTN